MCGRFANDAEMNELIEEFVAQGHDFRDWRPQYSIAPTDPVPIVRERQHHDTGEVQRLIEAANWDFRPSFVKDPKRPQFNARIETVAENGLWKGAFSRGRCLVPMRGYYEWQGEPGAKRAFFLQGREHLLAAAGICTARRTDEGWQLSTAIITRAARDASGEIHDRMPVFLPADAWDEYLSPEALDDAGRAHMVERIHEASDRVAPSITTFEVDPKVNSTRRVNPADASLIKPIAAPGGGE